MKILANLFAVTVAVALGISLSGCAGDSSVTVVDNDIKFDAAATGSLPAITDSTVIKNKVVNVNGSSDTFFEYLKFTSTTGGEYYLYKLEGEDLNSQANFNGSPVPSSFTYDSTNGKVVVGTKNTYMFNAGSDFGIAEEICTVVSGTETEKLFQKWNATAELKISLDECGAICFTKNNVDYGSEFVNLNGWIFTTKGIGFCWIKIQDNMKLYYMAYKTERSEVIEVGRFAESNEISLVSSNFLFLK